MEFLKPILRQSHFIQIFEIYFLMYVFWFETLKVNTRMTIEALEPEGNRVYLI